MTHFTMQFIYECMCNHPHSIDDSFSTILIEQSEDSENIEVEMEDGTKYTIEKIVGESYSHATVNVMTDEGEELEIKFYTHAKHEDL